MAGSKNLLVIFGSAVAVVVVVAITIGWWQSRRFSESTNNAYVAGDVTAFSPKVSGYVEKLLVNDNQVVHKGDVLVVIERKEYQARVDRARAAVARKRAGFANIEHRRLLQATLIDEADASTSAHQADLQRTAKDLVRAKQLVTEGWVSKQGEEYATTDELKARATLTSAQAAAMATRQKIAVLDSEKDQLLAEIAQAEADLRLAEIDLEATTIRAPTSGVVGNRRVRVGEYVRPGARLLALVPLDSVWIVANFKETQLTNMSPGNPAEVEIDAFPGVSIQGGVDSFSPASGAQFSLLPPENATGNFTKVVQRIPVKIILPPDHPLIGRLIPGMSVVATVDTGATGDAIAQSGSP